MKKVVKYLPGMAIALVLAAAAKGLEALEADVAFSKITSMKVIEKIGRMKYVHEDEFAAHIAGLNKEMDAEFLALVEGGNADA